MGVNPEGSETTTSVSSKSNTEEVLVATVKPAADPPLTAVPNRVESTDCTIVPSLVLVIVQKEEAVPVNPKVSVFAKAGDTTNKDSRGKNERFFNMVNLQKGGLVCNCFGNLVLQEILVVTSLRCGAGDSFRVAVWSSWKPSVRTIGYRQVDDAGGRTCDGRGVARVSSTHVSHKTRSIISNPD